MNGFRALVRAPSNIALIKYMGKADPRLNLPENSSLSMTLDSLCTWVAIERVPGEGRVVLRPGPPPGAPASARMPDLSAKGREKVIAHVGRVRAAMGDVLAAHGFASRADLAAFDGADLALWSANTFPEASGIASSASSFAAITLATALACAHSGGGRDGAQAFRGAWERDPGLRRSLARIARQGSGSACRSLEGPFVLWEGEEARAVEVALPALSHFVILVSSEAKAVSSSEAHLAVKTSPLWEGRVARVERRLALLRAALASGDLRAAAALSWSESWEMHSLFHTSAEPFSYWKPGTIDALQWLAPFVAPGAGALSGTAPIVTLDAGPNLHVIVPEAESADWRARLHARFGAAAILEDRPGRGATIEDLA